MKLRLLLFVLLGVGVWTLGDPMLERALRAGARPATLCAARGEAGCAGAVWARYWLLARASCAARAGGRRVPVLLDTAPEQCRHIPFDLHKGIEALVQFVHPSYAPPALDEPAAAAPDPLDAALVLLSTPAPTTRADNHSATSALLPELNSWLRYVPAQVPWTRGPAPAPAPPSPLLGSALGMLLSTILAPVAALLATFWLLLRWPQEAEEPTDEEMLVESDALGEPA